MVMARVKEETTSLSPAPGPGEAKGANKRRCVQSACIPCRKRKSKCDGGTPECGTCAAVYKTPCFYDAESDARRPKTTPAKRDSASVAGDNNHAEFLINTIRSLPEPDAYELIQQIRKDSPLDLASLADSWRPVTIPHTTQVASHSLEGELSLLLGKPATTQTGESRHFGHTSSLGLVPEDENYTRSRITTAPEEHKNGTWSTVTSDIKFVHRLFDLYFLWSHPFYVIFSREAFYQDFRSGRQKYCSPLLVNAILAFACHFSDEPQARVDPNDPRTAGDHFFAEARTLLFENETPSLTTTQALCVMAMREPSAGRDSSGFMYMGRCMRMCVELGLHLKDSIPPNLTNSEIEVRKVTFWGCFVVDTAWSVCIGRISQLPRAAITLEKPILDEPNYDAHSDASHSHQSLRGQITSRLFLQQFSALSELVNDNNYMFFAPRDRFTDRRLLQTHKNYQNWYRGLPQVLQIPTDPHQRPLPHIMILHMYYHTIILHLFRPLLKVDIIHHTVTPRQMCVESANKISELLRHYRLHFSLRACQLLLSHIMLSVCIVHLLYSQESQTHADNLLEGLQALEELSTCHYFGARGFKIVYALAKTWNLPWPDALKNCALIPRDNASVNTPGSDSNNVGYPTPSSKSVSTTRYSTMNQQNVPEGTVRRESLTMFAQPHNALSTHPHTNQSSMIGLHNPTAPQVYPSNSALAPAITDQQLFWTPIQGMGVPLVPRSYQHLSPMDLNSVLGNEDEWERMNRDGFKMSETWVQEPMDFNGIGHQPASSMLPGHDVSGPVGQGWWPNDGTGAGMG